MKFFALLCSWLLLVGLALADDDAVSVDSAASDDAPAKEEAPAAAAPADDAAAAPSPDVLPASTSRLVLKPITIKAAPVVPMPLWHHAPLVVPHAPIIAHAPIAAPWLW